LNLKDKVVLVFLIIGMDTKEVFLKQKQSKIEMILNDALMGKL
jgi:hypothetical protein